MRVLLSRDAAPETRLDAKDKRILAAIAHDARMPRTAIAKKVGLSKDAVAYRLKRLEEQGIIQGYTAVVDTALLGFITYHLLITLRQPTKEERERIISLFKASPFVKVIIEFSGKYDFEVGVVARDVDELDRTIQGLVLPSETVHVLIFVRTLLGCTFPPGFVSPPVGNVPSSGNLGQGAQRDRGGRSSLAAGVDATDLLLLKELSLSATTPLYVLGGRVGLTGDAVRYRLRSLIASGVLMETRPVINYATLGYTLYTIPLEIAGMNAKKERMLLSFCQEDQGVLWAARTIGAYNALLYLCVKRTEDLHQTIIALRELFSTDLKSYETLVAYEEHKYTYFPEACFADCT